MNTNEENEVKQTININVPDVYHNGIDDNFGKGKVIANTLKKIVKDITNASFVKILKFFTTFTLFSFCCITAFFCYLANLTIIIQIKLIIVIVIIK